jgi:hypothetical protein
MQTHNIRTKWAPGYTGIEGNKAADKLADISASQCGNIGLVSQPIVSGIRSIFSQRRKEVQSAWWALCSTKLSARYK